MPGTVVTLAAEGNISLGSFAAEMAQFQKLVAALSKEIAQRVKIDWLLDDLEYGSAIASARGESAQIDRVEQVVAGFATVGRALERGEPIPYPQRVVTPARKLLSLLDSGFTVLRFQTHDADHAVLSPSLRKPVAVPNLSAYGAVEGTVQTVSSRGGLRFTLYDSLYDKAVSCFLGEDQQGLMRDAWGRRARVEGWVTRDAMTGRPVSIRQVRYVTIIPDVVPGAFRRARGLLPRVSDDPLPEDVIRRMRDA